LPTLKWQILGGGVKIELLDVLTWQAKKETGKKAEALSPVPAWKSEG
jgi:hypothetical protein